MDVYTCEIMAVCKNNVDIVEAESFQGFASAFDDTGYLGQQKVTQTTG